MASTNKTEHYRLPQFVQTDKPAWLTDINPAMSEIDAGIWAAKEAADGAATDATAASTAANAAQSAATEAKSTADTAKTTADEAKSTADSALQIGANATKIALEANNLAKANARGGVVNTSLAWNDSIGLVNLTYNLRSMVRYDNFIINLPFAEFYTNASIAPVADIKAPNNFNMFYIASILGLGENILNLPEYDVSNSKSYLQFTAADGRHYMIARRGSTTAIFLYSGVSSLTIASSGTGPATFRNEIIPRWIE